MGSLSNRRTALTVAAIFALATGGVRAAVLDPGTAGLAQIAAPFPTASGSYTFNTGSTPKLTGPGGVSINGAVFNDSGISVAVFDFASSFNLAAGQTFTVTGSMPLVLLSTGNITLSGGTINLDASIPFGGGGGGYNGVSSTIVTNQHSAFTGGTGASTFSAAGAGGGGLGGAGGHGGNAKAGGGSATNIHPDQQLFGGSGGGQIFEDAPGGGGGGAIEIGAAFNGSITITAPASIIAKGAQGATGSITNGAGAGSGGEIFLHAGSVSITAATALSVAGGPGGSGSEVGYGGGGGGGGEIEILAHTLSATPSLAADALVDGGVAGFSITAAGGAGSPGLLLTGDLTVPEPASAVLVMFYAANAVLRRPRYDRRH
jgi:hypothetical protein